MLDRLSKRDWSFVTLFTIVVALLFLAGIFAFGLMFWWGDR